MLETNNQENDVISIENILRGDAKEANTKAIRLFGDRESKIAMAAVETSQTEQYEVKTGERKAEEHKKIKMPKAVVLVAPTRELFDSGAIHDVMSLALFEWL